MSVFPAAEAMLRSPAIAVLATAARDGAPHATPVWLLRAREVLWIDAGAGSAKRRHVDGDARVAFTLDDRAWPYRSLIRGRATVVALRPARARRIARRYLGAEGELVHRAMLAEQERVSLRIDISAAAIHDMAGWDYRASAEATGAAAASSLAASRPMRSQRRRASTSARS